MTKHSWFNSWFKIPHVHERQLKGLGRLDQIVNYFIIPGNPPAEHFYQLWAREIEAQHAGAKTKVSIYPMLSPNEDSEVAMTQVLNAHHEQLEIFYRQTQRPVILLGHSLGAYFALRLLEKSTEMVKRAVLLHPFLRSPGLIGKGILTTVGSTPVQEVLGRSRKILQYFIPDLSHVSDDEVLKSFQLARHEGRTIGMDGSPLIIRPELRKKIHVLYTSKDVWCTSKVISQLREQVWVRECSVPHAFVVKELHRKSLLQKVLCLDW